MYCAQACRQFVSVLRLIEYVLCCDFCGLYAGGGWCDSWNSACVNSGIALADWSVLFVCPVGCTGELRWCIRSIYLAL